MKILVPTDFSKASNVAVSYATGIAKMFNAEIILLYVVTQYGTLKSGSSSKKEQIIDTKATDANKKLKAVIQTITKKNAHLRVTSVILVGTPLEEVVTNYAHYNDADLIVMGTKGENSTSPALLGSNTVATINTSTIPVISVPELSRYRKIKNIVYATDLDKLDHEVSLIVPLARLYNAMIDIIYVVPPGSKEKIDRAKIQQDVRSRSGYPKTRLHVILNESLTKGINEFLTTKKADLLAMYTHELGFFDRLFGKGVTRKMSFHLKIPLLAIKKESHLIKINKVTTERN